MVCLRQQVAARLQTFEGTAGRQTLWNDGGAFGEL